MTTKKLIIVTADTNSYPTMNFEGFIDTKEQFEEFIEDKGLSFLDIDWNIIEHVDAYKIQDYLNEEGDTEYLVRIV